MAFTGSVVVDWGDNTNETLFTDNPTDHIYGAGDLLYDYLTYEDGTPVLDDDGLVIYLD